ncbi:glycosyltransferase family 25 protein [Roseovarius sp. A21]|uniref:Glycosyltransferase family 25 protein n=1 Tax=Roseovarius bejariae TaxID=2576383 RepID=A0A844CZQ6_9RHOB|nr:glycosyltransferase family 25 protein [Roseovarius bejariae]MRU16080.1 glycosyltransferase family 25 protein [Roseovarius bejariae]
MTTRAYVLHLERATARRANAQALLKNCGLDGEIWAAVDGAKCPPEDLENAVGTGLFNPPYPFPLKTGEVGCFLSHRQIWADMQKHKAKASLIIEDDAGLDPEGFAQALALAERHVEHLGYIQFQTRAPKGPVTSIDTAGDKTLIVPQLGGLRTTAQLVSRDAAAHLLALSAPFDRPVDTFVQSHWHTGLRPAMIYPSGISEIADQLDGSTIQQSRKSLLERLSREWKRARFRRNVVTLSERSRAPATGGISGGPA